MLRTLLALAGLILLAPSTASADPFGELPFKPVKAATSCLQATGSPGELVSQTETSVELLTASAAGLSSGVTVPTDGAVDCVDVGAWPGGGGLLAFPVSDGLDGEVWVRGFLREPGQGWGEAIEILPPREHLMSGAIATAVSQRGDGLVSMSVIDAKGRADVR